MDLESKSPALFIITLILIIAYIVSRDRKKKTKADQHQLETNDATTHQRESDTSFILRCKSHIESYLNANQYQFYTSNSSPRYIVPFEINDSPYEIIITPYCPGEAKVIEFNARVTSVPVQDNMLATIAELTNRLNTHSINTLLYLDYESRHVLVRNFLIVSDDDINAKMFDQCFFEVLGAAKTRVFLNRVLLDNESPALVACEYAHL